LLHGLGMTVIPKPELGLIDADETGTTFVENAIIKARHAARLTRLAAIADDSGLTVDALDGRPGVYSARFAGPNATDQQNLAQLLADLEGLPARLRKATLWCVLVSLRHADDPTPLLFTCRWQATITASPRA